jgi:hypothetical protein
MIRLSCLTGLLAACLSMNVAAAETRQESCTPGELRSDSTPTCISIEWDVTGDSDHDATCVVQFREAGSAQWKAAELFTTTFWRFPREFWTPREQLCRGDFSVSFRQIAQHAIIGSCPQRLACNADTTTVFETLFRPPAT